MGKIIGYARVSTEDQNLDVQIDQLVAAGCEKIFQEKASAAKLDRPQLAALLEYVRDGDRVITVRFDRIARSVQHLLEIVSVLEKKDVAFKSLNADFDTSTATGKLMLTMLGAVAEFERSLLLERQREGIEKAKTKGVYKGRKATAQEKAEDVLRLIGEGKTRQQVAVELGIGIASVYRILKTQKTQTTSGK